MTKNELAYEKRYFDAKVADELSFMCIGKDTHFVTIKVDVLRDRLRKMLEVGFDAGSAYHSWGNETQQGSL